MSLFRIHLAIACLLAGVPAFAQAPRYTLEKLADGVHAVIYNPELETEGNTLIVVNDRDVVVVDSNAGITTAKMTIAEIRTLTPKPVAFVVNTHWHDDHVMGNQAYADAYPGVQFIAHPLTRQDIVDHAFANNAFVIDVLASDIKRIAGYLETGSGRDGKPFTPDTRARAQIAHDKRVEMLADRKVMRAVPPTIDVAESMTLQRGAREIQIRFLGRGNTRGDLVVHLPKERIVATGDLVVAPTPYATNAYVREWVGTLDKLMAIPAATILPGHGPVMRDWSYARQVKSALEQTLAAVAAAKKEGLTLQQTTERVQLPEVRDSFMKGVETRRAGYEAFFRTSLIRNAWEELDAATMRADEGAVTTKVAEGVYARLRKDPTADPVDANVVIIVNEKDVVLVDSNVTLASTRATVRAIRELTDKPVRYIVNTHWHDDHVLGNQVYKEAFPQAELVSHPLTRDDIEVRAYGGNADYTKQLEEILPKRRLERDDPKTPAERRASLNTRIPEFEALLIDLKNMKPTLPEVTVADEMTLNRAGREIRIVFLGRGNTRGDLVVHLPKERIVITGDHVVAPIPWATEVYPAEWVATLDKLAALPADTIIPGHGPVMRDQQHLRKVQSLVRQVMADVKAARGAGLTLEQATEKIQLSEVRDQMTGGDARKVLLFEEAFRKSLIKRVWQEQADRTLP